ncbi:hypothetical protein P154DRAFT_584800 [Amniculicola lignicola CBS 123094]|uniref:Uncharacterized protein n=1 Tax=Amniculicola lignicola CBS 123094 TaxID=1392246 RepID=A0A6A5X5P6_9PLEO|nr:hypothetical protein P154DRAFT_584800 [Amniculicola lignicola CBS 123094]
MASMFQKPLKSIVRKANRYLEGSEIEKLLKPNKRGEWSDHEIQHLIELREQRLPLKSIGMWLRRTSPSVQKKLWELRDTISGPGTVEGPQALPPGLQEILFYTRLTAVWEALLKSDMTQTWREALQEKSKEEWLSIVSAGIPQDVKNVLGGLRPPTWDELESLPLIDTNDAGMYARLVTSRHKFQMVTDRHLYVGSASKYGGGLNHRIDEHTRKMKRKHESRLQSDIRKKRLEKNGRFITLMVVKMDSPDNDVVLDVRRTVVLAEAILTVWLNALQDPSEDLQSVSPWDSQTLQYTGWASHNPLLVDVVLPFDGNREM